MDSFCFLELCPGGVFRVAPFVELLLHCLHSFVGLFRGRADFFGSKKLSIGDVLDLFGRVV